MPRTDRESPATVARRKKILERVSRMHELGQRALEQDADREALKREFGVTDRVLRQAKQFAGEFGHAELSRIKKLLRSNGLPLQFNHLVYLMTIDGSDDRFKWAQRAVDNDWTVEVLHTRIKAGRPARERQPSPHGRTVERPKDVRSAAEKLAVEADRWSKQAAVLLDRIGDRGVRSQRVRTRLEESLTTMRRRAKDVASALK